MSLKGPPQPARPGHELPSGRPHLPFDAAKFKAKIERLGADMGVRDNWARVTAPRALARTPCGEAGRTMEWGLLAELVGAQGLAEIEYNAGGPKRPPPPPPALDGLPLDERVLPLVRERGLDHKRVHEELSAVAAEAGQKAPSKKAVKHSCKRIRDGNSLALTPIPPDKPLPTPAEARAAAGLSPEPPPDRSHLFGAAGTLIPDRSIPTGAVAAALAAGIYVPYRSRRTGAAASGGAPLDPPPAEPATTDAALSDEGELNNEYQMNARVLPGCGTPGASVIAASDEQTDEQPEPMHIEFDQDPYHDGILEDFEDDVYDGDHDWDPW